jgi:hypothetical protein
VSSGLHGEKRGARDFLTLKIMHNYGELR